MPIKRGRTAALVQQRPIQQFGKITKLQSTIPKNDARKRKLDDEISPNFSSAETEVPSTPRKKARLPVTAEATPTKGARRLLQTFNLSSPSPRSPFRNPNQLEIPPSSQEQDAASELPEELQDLVDLHSCFLTSLSLHYVHNGSMTPADLRILCPTIAKTWGKRYVTHDDLRRALAVQQTHSINGRSLHLSALTLSDYGNGKICIEFPENGAQQSQRMPIDEKELNYGFCRSLRLRWQEYQKSTPTTPSVLAFIAALPLHPIKLNPSLIKLTPFLSKSQTRLTDLKAGAIRAQERALKVTTGNTLPTTTQASKPKDPFARSDDLKTRIFAKQLQKSTLPIPLSPDQLARRSALQRIPEIAPVLESLALSAQRHCDDDAGDPWKQASKHVSFTMPTLVQNLQMSLRNPVSAEEAVSCVRILGELVPGWVSVKAVGKLIGVTIRGTGIGRSALAGRVEVALGNL